MVCHAERTIVLLVSVSRTRESVLTSFGMRFGGQGRDNGFVAFFAEGASLLLFEHHADEVIYLGPDDALRPARARMGWASGGQPSFS